MLDEAERALQQHAFTEALALLRSLFQVIPRLSDPMSAPARDLRYLLRDRFAPAVDTVRDLESGRADHAGLRVLRRSRGRGAARLQCPGYQCARQAKAALDQHSFSRAKKVPGDCRP